MNTVDQMQHPYTFHKCLSLCVSEVLAADFGYDQGRKQETYTTDGCAQNLENY